MVCGTELMLCWLALLCLTACFCDVVCCATSHNDLPYAFVCFILFSVKYCVVLCCTVIYGGMQCCLCLLVHNPFFIYYCLVLCYAVLYIALQYWSAICAAMICVLVTSLYCTVLCNCDLAALRCFVQYIAYFPRFKLQPIKYINLNNETIWTIPYSLRSPQAEMVAVKRMKKKEISISRKILIEVKQASIFATITS